MTYAQVKSISRPYLQQHQSHHRKRVAGNHFQQWHQRRQSLWNDLETRRPSIQDRFQQYDIRFGIEGNRIRRQRQGNGKQRCRCLSNPTNRTMLEL